MGIYDRDYMSEGRGRRGGGVSRRVRGVGLGGLSMVQILIIINVAVFALDMLLPTVQVGLGDRFLEGYDRQGKTLVVVEQVINRPADPTRAVPGALAHPIVDQQTGDQVGERHFTYMKPLEAIGYFSTGKALNELQIWRFVTFQFLHSQGLLMHIVFNMIGLFFFGPLAERYLGSRRLFLAFYLACGIGGAALYLFLNLLGSFFQGANYLLLVNDIYTPLVGASAGVFGVLMAAAYVAGRETMLVFFVIPMRVDIGVYGFVGIAVLNLFLQGNNAGGDAAHLGGAIAGFYLIRRPQLLIDFFDDFLFSGPAKKSRKGRQSFRSKHGGATRKAKGMGKELGQAVKGMVTGSGEPSQAEVDAILDKVNRSGMQSLTDREREMLRRASGD